MASTTKTTTAEFTDADFDNWDDEAEVAALTALNQVKYIIVEGDFVGRFPDGEIIRLPLKLKTDMIQELQQTFEEPLDQFRQLIQAFADDATAERFDAQGLILSAIMAEKFFRAIARAQELAFPES